MSTYKKPVRLIAAYKALVGVHLDYIKAQVPYGVSYSTRCNIDEKIETILEAAEGYDAYVALYDDYKELLAVLGLDKEVAFGNLRQDDDAADDLGKFKDLLDKYFADSEDGDED